MSDLVSFIICSIDQQKFDRVEARINQCLTVPHEIIHIDDATSLCAGYTEGLARSAGHIVVFCHDDIDFLSDEALWPRLAAHLETFDVVGVAGTTEVVGPLWMSGGPNTWAGLVIHHKAGNSYDLTAFDNHPELITPVQALDGVFFAMRREVAEQVGFDAETFDGFHGYDIDFTYRCHLAGYRLGAAKDLLLVHESGGNFGEQWRKYGQRFLNKFPQFSQKSLRMGVRFSPCTVVIQKESEARCAANALLSTQGFDPEDYSEAASSASQDAEFKAWKMRKSLQEIDGQVLAERMLKWQTKPVFNIILEAHLGEENLLADSIDSLAAQWYPNWHLTIVADFPCADPELAAFPQISWIEAAPEDMAQAINEALPHLPGDWLCFIEAGCTLEPHGLAYFGDTIDLYPQASLVYCDEDRLASDDNTEQPRFKPGFNLELLRGMYYLGTGLTVERAIFTRLGGLKASGMAGLYDLTLRVSETRPGSSLVHLPEILVHTPAIGLREIDPDAEQAALREHFVRQGIQAQVTDGLLVGTQAVVYPVTGEPLVSIIIPSHDQPGYLSHCIESLLAETAYANFEIVLVEHQTRDPDAVLYIQELTQRPELANRLQIVRNDEPFNYARLCNLGAAAAQGELLLFLDNDTEFIQKDWLTRLIGHIQQRAVAAVAPRLSCPDGNLSTLNQGPRILGLSQVAGPMAGDQANIVEPGYYGNLQVAQEVSALSGSCFMIRADLFRGFGGFNAVNTPIHEPVLELCLRLRQARHLLVWTPWVDVIHRHRSTRKRLSTNPEAARSIEQAAEQERDFLLGHFMPQLASDPYYHRHLSLQQPYAIEPHAVIDWDTRHHDRLRVLGSPLSGGSGEYRMLAPFRALQKAGLAQCCHVHPIGHQVQRVLTPVELARAAPDTLMVQQAIEDLTIWQMRRYRQFNRDIFMTYGVDDIIGNLPKKHYLYNFQIREGKSRLREGLALCDRLIASTEPIAEFCRGMVDDIVIVPNCLEGERWLPQQSQRRVGPKPRVGWAGAQQHLGDLELIKDVVQATHTEVDWIFMGMCPDFLKPFVKEEHGFVNFTEYPAKLASLNLDLAIAPLEQVIFNEGKSNLRLLEYGIMGWPVVCTDVYPYQTNNAPVKRVQNDVAAWVEAIRERVYDLDAAAQEGDRLREWVLEHYILENNLDRWLAAVTPR